jgi:hypothetical protein
MNDSAFCNQLRRVANMLAGSETDEVVESKGNADSTGGQEAAKSNALSVENGTI